ncbi:VWA domain-containing protein [Chloroflexales bacterium ZM16-3]|nr:VWA domain-containing protein [Chloroflexales bacterium ZM16-3]
MILRNPQMIWLLLLLPTFALLWRWRGVRVSLSALLLRLGAVAALVLALADPSLGAEPPPVGPLVILVDQSDSLSVAGRAALLAEAERLASEASPHARLLTFGANVVADDPAQAPDPAGSDVAAALRAARALLPGGGRVVLLSDGVQTTGDALAEARLAAEAGISIDVGTADVATLPDAAITSVTAPRLLRAGEEFPITIGVRYDPGSGGLAGDLSARLRLWNGAELLGDQQISLSPGDDSFTFRHVAGDPGVLQLRAELTVPTGDTFVANNGGGATAIVVPPPNILLVTGRPGDGVDLAAALNRQGVQTSQIDAVRLPSRLSELSPYDGMVLIDVPAASLSLDQMAGVREFVRSEGRGLVATGGRNSFTLGSYKGTPLEDVLPVTMEPPPRPQRTNIALLLIVDRSASMTAALGVSKLDMAKEAAQLATDSLQADDRIGILGFDTGTLWVVPFQQIGAGLSVAQIQEQIANLPSGGGTDIERALDTGLPALAQQPSEVRHAVLLTDGRSYSNNFGSYQQLVETARAQQITLSTIAIGADSDTALLDQLAQWGGGRYYYAGRPEDIPRLTLLESEIARADPVVEEPLRASLAEVHPIMRDFAPADLPELGGYVAVTERDSADVVLRSPEGDPLLAAWQYGLGRAVAWLPGVSAPWASQWPAWDGYDRFWAQLVRYTLPDQDSGPLQVRLVQQPGGARLMVDAIQAGGNPLNLATVNARITLPDGTARGFDVRQTAPGRYTQDLSLPASGPYVISVVLQQNGQRQQRDVGYVQPVPAEYLPSADDGRPQGAALLRAIADATGGSALDQIAVSADAPAEDAPAAPATDLWPWLIGLALGLWVLEVAVRRGLFIR